MRILSESLDATDHTTVRKLLDAGANVYVQEKYGATPLFLASQIGLGWIGHDWEIRSTAWQGDTEHMLPHAVGYL